MGWDAFVTAIKAAIDSHGWHFVARAYFPEPMAAEVEGFYSVPVSQGLPGYIDRHGHEHPV